MMKYASLILLILSFQSCSEEKVVVPITVDKQVDLLIDLYAAETLLGKMPTKDRDSLKIEYRKQIATIHDLREDELDSYLEMMQKDRLYYFRLQKMVVDSLKQIQDSIAFKSDKIKSKPKKENKSK